MTDLTNAQKAEAFLKKGYEVPQHILISPDGNRRWTKLNNTGYLKGHFKGAQIIFDITEFCDLLGVKNITFFAYSNHNFARKYFETLWIKQLVLWGAEKIKNRLRSLGIGFKCIGHFENVGEKYERKIKEIECIAETGHTTLTLLSIYSGQEEIFEAAKKLAHDAIKNPSLLDTCTKDDFESYMPITQLGPVDMSIRTGGAFRLSDAPLWHQSFTELFFTKTLWPDFTVDELLELIEEFNHRERRFGK